MDIHSALLVCMFTRLPTCCKLGQQVRNMNTAIGIEKFMDLAGDLAGGIAGLPAFLHAFRQQ